MGIILFTPQTLHQRTHPCRTAIEAAAQYQQKYQRGDQRIYNPHAISPGRLRQRKETKYRIRQPPCKNGKQQIPEYIFPI